MTIEIPHDPQHKPTIDAYCTNPCSRHETCPLSTPPKSTKHCYKLPVVKGNLKYPNKCAPSCHFNLDIQSTSDIKHPLEESRVGNERNRNFCMQTCDYDIRKKQTKAGTLHMSKVMQPSVQTDNGPENRRQSTSSAKRQGNENNEDLTKLKNQCPKGIEVVLVIK